MKRNFFLLMLFLAFPLVPTSAQNSKAAPMEWKQAMRQATDWYRSDEAMRIARAVVAWQHPNGGWPKNRESEMLRGTLAPALDLIAPETTIDNGATTGQLRFLSRVFEATKDANYQKSIERGIDFLLQAQYANGGWPQFFPLKKGYHSHITFNDNAMIEVMTFLRDIALQKNGLDWFDQARRERCARAVERGIDCIVKCQVRVNGEPTVWCAQHYETTLQAAPARAFEPVSLSGIESVGIVRFLMSIEKPNVQVQKAIVSAVQWFEQNQIRGWKVQSVVNAELEAGRDMVLIEDENAPPLWARFSEIGTNRPLFSGRDGVVKFQLSQIEHERRIGYAWYGSQAASLLQTDWPRWKKQWQSAP